METSGVAPGTRPCRGRVILFHHVPRVDPGPNRRKETIRSSGRAGPRTPLQQKEGGGLAPHAPRGGTSRFPGASGPLVRFTFLLSDTPQRGALHPAKVRRGVAPRSRVLQTRASLHGSRTVSGRRMAEDSHLTPRARGARLSKAARRAGPVRHPGPPRPGLAPGSVRLTAGRSTLELARNDRGGGIRTPDLPVPNRTRCWLRYTPLSRHGSRRTRTPSPRGDRPLSRRRRLAGPVHDPGRSRRRESHPLARAHEARPALRVAGSPRRESHPDRLLTTEELGS